MTYQDLKAKNEKNTKKKWKKEKKLTLTLLKGKILRGLHPTFSRLDFHRQNSPSKSVFQLNRFQKHNSLTVRQLGAPAHLGSTPRPRTALLTCLKMYSAIGNSAIGNYVVVYSKLTPETVLLEVSYVKNDKKQCYGRTFGTN